MKYRNIKNRKIYTRYGDSFTNTTNDQDGQKMIGYFDEQGKMYVREAEEFHTKFESIK